MATKRNWVDILDEDDEGDNNEPSDIEDEEEKQP